MNRQGTNIIEGVEIELGGETERLRRADAIEKLVKIGVLLPLNPVEQGMICRVETDEVTSAAVVRAEDGPAPLERGKRVKNIYGA